MHKLSDLRDKDVINVADARRLGYVTDVDVDPETGRIVALICPGAGRWFGLFGGRSEQVIPWERVLRIGPDVILVDLGEGPSGLTDLRGRGKGGPRDEYVRLGGGPGR